MKNIIQDMKEKSNKFSVYTILGASNHTDKEREKDDYYATDPLAAKMLMDLEELNYNIYEPSCGEGHLSKVFESAGHNVYSTDLIERGYGIGGMDFLKRTELFNGDIITNPPYKHAKEFMYVWVKGYKGDTTIKWFN
jgi:hypothetical protein